MKVQWTHPCLWTSMSQEIPWHNPASPSWRHRPWADRPYKQWRGRSMLRHLFLLFHLDVCSIGLRSWNWLHCEILKLKLIALSIIEVEVDRIVIQCPVRSTCLCEACSIREGVCSLGRSEQIYRNEVFAIFCVNHLTSVLQFHASVFLKQVTT